MSRIYNMPPDTRERDKVFGGILDMRQVGWLAFFGGLGLVVILLIGKLIIWLGLILSIPFFIVGGIMAFKQKLGMPYPEYLKLKRRYNNTIKYYINSGRYNKFDFDISITKESEE